MKVVRGEAQNYSWESAPAAALVSALVDPMQVLFTPFVTCFCSLHQLIVVHFYAMLHFPVCFCSF